MACVLSELLNIPHITLEYGSSVQCKNTFVLRPDLDQLNTAVITMIKEDKPKVVAVITEGKKYIACVYSPDHCLSIILGRLWNVII